MACLDGKMSAFYKVRLLHICACLHTLTGTREFENCFSGRTQPCELQIQAQCTDYLLWRVIGVCEHNCRVWNIGMILQNVGPVAYPWVHAPHANGFHVITITVKRVGFGVIRFWTKILEPAQALSTWRFNLNGRTRLRYHMWYFTPSFKFGK